MRFSSAIDKVLRTVPGAKGATAIAEAKYSINMARRVCATRKPWPFLLREGVAQNAGAYEDAQVTVTQGSRTVTATAGTWPSGCAGWAFKLSNQSTEQYMIASRTSGSVIVLDRPWEGDTDTGQPCIVWDRYCLAPRDLYKWKSLKCERAGYQINYEDPNWFDAQWMAGMQMGTDAVLTTLTHRSTSAFQATGTVTIARGDATVTLAGSTWPELMVGRHLQFNGEDEMYRVASVTSTTIVELDREYAGRFPGAGVAYELDPPGCVLLEIAPPVEDRFALKVKYYAEPELLVGDNDLLEGPDTYQDAVTALAKSMFVSSQLQSVDAGPDGQSPLYMQMVQKAQKLESDSERLMIGLLGNTVAPDQHARIRNVKYM